jgi:hypothetical protein
MYFCPELFLFLKGMTGALAPFSYLVDNVLPLEYNFIVKKPCQPYFTT